jgi:glycosyltransferase involved in cell wall biosynthesis
MRILIIHNVLWAHYKSLLFSRLYQQLAPTDTMLVIQLALTEGHRQGLGMPDAHSVGYPFEVLHPGPLDELSALQRAWRLLRAGWAFRPDVVLLTGYYDPAQLLLGTLLKLRGCRVILQNESTALDNPRTGWREGLKRAFVRLCDGYFCFGTRAADYLIELGAAPGNILVRNNAVVDNAALARTHAAALPQRTAEQQRLGLKPHNLVYVGRLVAPKNLSMLLEAFAEAVKTTPEAADWGLILLGEGDQKTALQAQTAQLGLTGRVAFLPGCNWQDVPRFLALADALVLPSLSEPWGLVVNEAMACGLPVLVSERCGCAVDLVQDGQNGFTFAPQQPSQLAHHIGALVKATPAERTRMGAESARMVQAFDPDTVGRAMYEGIVAVGSRQ